jgi:hypothetical protein
VSETTQPRELHCTACDKDQVLDSHWYQMRIAGDGKLTTTPITDPDHFERDDSADAHVCGSTCLLILTERYADRRTFEPAPPVPASELHEFQLSQL